jgi:hypothetical protein
VTIPWESGMQTLENGKSAYISVVNAQNQGTISADIKLNGKVKTSDSGTTSLFVSCIRGQDC